MAGRGERVAVQLSRSGGADPAAASAAQDPAGVNEALASLGAEFEALYSDFG